MACQEAFNGLVFQTLMDSIPKRKSWQSVLSKMRLLALVSALLGVLIQLQEEQFWEGPVGRACLALQALTGILVLSRAALGSAA